ncbi:hypothetical protein C3K47_15770 [Solitalea longa]|uniref:Uncharacterized protein n=1 Tax=Solitalea longa TaxID=2079460 RepID=A0A2S4ZY05_9SPHI|nr:hypothetical protein [Solitalea longa]POY35241.1 hypothetical protein C3K47_15770 [Solitalea longa]
MGGKAGERAFKVLLTTSELGVIRFHSTSYDKFREHFNALEVQFAIKKLLKKLYKDMKNKKYRFVCILLLAFCLSSARGLSQSLDSARVYAISMHRLYKYSINKAYIPMEAEPIVLKDSNQLYKLYSTIIDSVITGKGKSIKSNYPYDLRLYFEFFKDGKVVKEIGFTTPNQAFINLCLYSYDKKKLKSLDKYISGLYDSFVIK